MARDYDTIIVGGGSAGCVAATRLVRDHGARVLLIERGPARGHPILRMPAGYMKFLAREDYLEMHQAVPQPQLDGRAPIVPQARLLGGGSAVNAMVYMRGQREDYDGWDAFLGGGSSWSYAELLPYFTAMERNTRLGPPYHGTAGTLVVGDPGRIDPMSRAYMDAIQSLGIPANPDFNGARQAGVGPMQHTYGRSGRSSAVRAFLDQVRRDPRLSLVTEALVTRVLIEHGRAVGVEYVKDGAVTQARAAGEVLVAAGTYNTAKLLMLSGIGPAAHLRAHGIAVVADLPGVGENLQDHHEVPVISAARGPMGYYGQDRGWRMLRNGLQYLLTRTGPVATTGVECCAFLDPDGGERPTIQLYFVPTVYFDRDVTDIAPTWGCTLTPCLLRPKARGTVRLRSADPRDKPLVDSRFFGHPDDLRLTLAAMRFARRVLAAPPLSGLVAHEMLPGSAAQSDDDLTRYAKRMVKTNYHPVGTARMGPPDDAMAVLDTHLRVRGVDALRVIDCAAIPFIPSGNTNAAALMLGSRAVALIRNENAPPDALAAQRRAAA
jgi:choline dehydrogenase